MLNKYFLGEFKDLGAEHLDKFSLVLPCANTHVAVTSLFRALMSVRKQLLHFFFYCSAHNTICLFFFCLLESGGVSNLAGTDLRVCQPGHGSLRAAQRAADRWRVHQGGVCPPHPPWPHARFQAAGACSGRRRRQHIKVYSTECVNQACVLTGNAVRWWWGTYWSVIFSLNPFSPLLHNVFLCFDISLFEITADCEHARFTFGLKVYQNLLCIFLPMLLQASNMVSGLCCFTSASLCPALSVALKAKNFHLTFHSSVKRITESRPSSVTTDILLVFDLTWCLCRADPADIPAEDGPSVDQDAARGDQELCAAHGLQSSGSPLSTDPGATGEVTGAA